MAEFMKKSEFLNTNIAIMQKRETSQYAIFLDSKPSFTNYYHINVAKSKTDKGLLSANGVLNREDPLRYNKIVDFPVYGIEPWDVNLQDEDQGLDTTIEGTCTILPNTIHPFPNDYFILQYLEKPYLLRITSVNLTTIKSNSFFRCEYELWSAKEHDVHELEALVVENYHCIFDNIGTTDKCIIRDEEYDLIARLFNIRKELRNDYLDKYKDKDYNALMYMRAHDMYLYDPMLNSFCNHERVFEVDEYNTTDVYLFYEEKRNFHVVEYENSFYDRLIHKDLTDLDVVNIFYDMEPTTGMGVSIFDFHNDRRTKYLMGYPSSIGPFGNPLSEYIHKNVITALELKDNALLTDPLELFLWHYMMEDTIRLRDHLDLINTRRMRYTFHNYIFIPMVLYTLRQLYKEIITDIPVIDERILEKSTLKGMTDK